MLVGCMLVPSNTVSTVSAAHCHAQGPVLSVAFGMLEVNAVHSHVTSYTRASRARKLVVLVWALNCPGIHGVCVLCNTGRLLVVSAARNLLFLFEVKRCDPALTFCKLLQYLREESRLF